MKRNPKQYKKPRREYKKMKKRLTVRFCRNCMRLFTKHGWKEVSPRNLMGLVRDKENDVIPMLCEPCLKIIRLRNLEEASKVTGACGEE